ncbi:DNA repair protein complementing XP-C cells homolog [Cloeon dipterum]|uniref:DNA repair protein complementing XP-C cells homolog n=1 Tax=Cloeon dipterum TaxID=197152 RepID=UPI0032200A9B
MPKRKTAPKADVVNDDKKKPKLDNFAVTRRQSTRRSTAKAQELIKKQSAEPDSEHESVSQSSDEDFVVPKNETKLNGFGKACVVPAINSFLSSDDSSEDEEKPEITKRNKKPAKKAATVPAKKAAAAPVKKDAAAPAKKTAAAPAKNSSRSVLSSDSESEFEDVAPVKPEVVQVPKILAEVSQLTDSESDLEDVPAQNLFELFPMLKKQNEVKVEEKKVKAKVEEKKIDSSTLNVSQLLAMGETQEPVPSTSKSEPKERNNRSKSKKKQKGADSDGSDWEEVEHGQEQSFPKEGVEVNIETETGLKKKKTKSMDLEAIIKRRINQIRREKQVELHKASLLCCLCHGMYINKKLNSPTLMAVALSILPSQHCYPPKKCDLSYLEKIVSWFKKKITVTDGKEDKNLNLVEQLERSFQEMKAPNKKLLVLMFVAMMRSLGLKTRLIISLQPLSLKPSSHDLLAVNAKPEESKSNKEVDKKTDKTTKESQKKKEEKPSKKTTKAAPKKSTVEQKSGKAAAKPKRQKKEKESKYFSGKSESSPDVEQKLKSLRKRKTEKYAEASSESDIETTKSSKSKKKSNAAKKEETSDEDDFKPEVLKIKKNSKISVADRRILSTDSERSNSPQVSKKGKVGIDYWAEVFAEMEEKWISIDIVSGKVHCVEHLYSKASTPVLYVMGLDQTVRDLSRRYCPQYHTSTRKQRVDQAWWEEAINPFYGKKSAFDKEEEEEMNKHLQDRPVPKTLSELKSHPLYCLKRHLLKYEGIYPPDAPPLGWFKDEPIFARECVFVLRSRETWLKEAKVVKPKQDPYKIVKSRPKYDRMSGQMVDGQPLELFGPWQTDDYVPPTAKDGKVPRNEYGNVELFKPCMLPKGTVHIPISTLNKVAKKLDIDCAPAMVGFDFHCGGCHPVFDGFIVCEEYKDTLLDAHRQDEEEKAKRGEEKRLKRIYGNWKKLINGLLIREKIMKKYDFGQGSSGKEKEKGPKEAGESSSNSKGTARKLKQPVKRKKQESEDSSDSS